MTDNRRDTYSVSPQEPAGGFRTALAAVFGTPRTPTFVLDSLRSSTPWLSMVETFHRLYEMPIAKKTDDAASHMSNERIELRLNLIFEEFQELVHACGFHLTKTTQEAQIVPLGMSRNVVEMADGLGDLIYVVCGFAVELGIDLNAVVREIHASNMTKLDENGRPIIREDGKVLKGPNYMAPQLQRVIIFDRQPNGGK